jgi:hypothetical protein
MENKDNFMMIGTLLDVRRIILDVIACTVSKKTIKTATLTYLREIKNSGRMKENMQCCLKLQNKINARSFRVARWNFCYLKGVKWIKRNLD